MNINDKDILKNSINGKIVDKRQGASGVIYIVDNGENTQPRKIAYKSVRVDKLNNEKQEHFLDECNLWFTVSNNYLVKPFFSKIIDGLPFICMPYYELDLKTFMLKNKLTEVEALVISAQLSKALWEMQKSGIEYHQDFNPPNILIDDLSHSFPDSSKSNCINYSMKISDFGIANLIKKIGPTIGGGGGKFPFKAPEQYCPKKYDSYNPDIFALGVMTYMLFTNKHPNGLVKEKALNKNTSGSKFKKWAFNTNINLSNSIIEQLINKSLSENPSTRPTAEFFYNTLMCELGKQDKETCDNLELRHNYFDHLNKLKSVLKEIDILNKLSKLPNNKYAIYNQIISSFPDMFAQVSSEKELIKLSEYYKFVILLADEESSHQLIEYSKKLLELFSKWHYKVKVKHIYPEDKFQDKIIFETPDIRDIEIVADYINSIYRFLSNYMENNEIEELFKQYNDDIFYSIFLYAKASLVRLTDIYICIDLLDEAKYLNSKEPLFEYMKYLWIPSSILTKDKELDKIRESTYKSLKNNYQNWKLIEELRYYENT